jgi:hypothetical protein
MTLSKPTKENNNNNNNNTRSADSEQITLCRYITYNCMAGGH